MTWYDPVEVVRLGYDDVSQRYRSDDADPAAYRRWLAELRTLLSNVHPRRRDNAALPG